MRRIFSTQASIILTKSMLPIYIRFKAPQLRPLSKSTCKVKSKTCLLCTLPTCLFRFIEQKLQVKSPKRYVFILTEFFNQRLPAPVCETTKTVELAMSDVVIIAIKFVRGNYQLNVVAHLTQQCNVLQLCVIATSVTRRL